MNKYEIRIIPKNADDGSTYWTAYYPSFQDCVGCGDTPEEAIQEAKDNLNILIEYLLEEGKTIPNEYAEPSYSGKIALRIAKSTHKKLALFAENEGISINTLLNNAIENYLGIKNYEYKLNEVIENINNLTLGNVILQQRNANYIKKMWESFGSNKTCSRIGE